ncbi:MAG TPA: phosphatase PAP2 family protein [Parafilimonas sp.]|nr:phosphatase PAP2 family protein [Parafilimonas sp.]
MKKLISFIILLSVPIIYYSCSKEIHGTTDNLRPLQPGSLDIDAGSWKPVLLSRVDTFSVAVPPLTNSPAYIADLNEIKAYQQNLSSEQRSKVSYWAAGGVLRWNELMRELVAKHNLPAYQNEDGTYPIPNSLNPFNYPQFPFSNPPYAARAYAYVSGAQYDALIACWHYKALYKQPAPYKVDSMVVALNGKSDLPSYPSEAGVLAGVTAEMMKLLFPTEIAAIQQKLEEQELATIESGTATRTDIKAGEALGRSIAQVFIARAKTDNASKAVGTPEQWAQLDSTCRAKGEIPWHSLEDPTRPPMLPFFGNVKPFLFDSLTVISLRPQAPPSTHSAEMQNQVDEVYNYTKNPTQERTRIIQFWADGAGTYTPPGHWNYIACQDFLDENYSEVRWARNLALLNMSMMDAAIVCWNTKYYCYYPRPSQMNPQIKTLTGMPNFPSYMSGHSTFSAAAASILGHIIPSRAGAYDAMAQEASMSRLYGGIHYHMDCDAGLETGEKIGGYAISRAKTDGAE